MSWYPALPPPSRHTNPLVSVYLPVPAPLRNCPPNLILVPEFIPPNLETTLEALVKQFVRFDPNTGRFDWQLGSVFTRFSTELTPLLPLHTSAPHVLLQLIEDIEHIFLVSLAQAIMLVYPAGRGIGQHSDLRPLGDTVFSLSMAADTEMHFTHPHFPPFSVHLPRRSLLVMSGPARYEWKHGIKDASVQAERTSITLRGNAVNSPPQPSW